MLRFLALSYNQFVMNISHFWRTRGRFTGVSRLLDQNERTLSQNLCLAGAWRPLVSSFYQRAADSDFESSSNAEILIWGDFEYDKLLDEERIPIDTISICIHHFSCIFSTTFGIFQRFSSAFAEVNAVRDPSSRKLFNSNLLEQNSNMTIPVFQTFRYHGSTTNVFFISNLFEKVKISRHSSTILPSAWHPLAPLAVYCIPLLIHEPATIDSKRELILTRLC
jgi:hypothetical protein